jgi:uncharacterized membrane protein
MSAGSSAFSTIAGWLRQGWRDFRGAPDLTMGFSAVFLAIGALATALLIHQGLPLIAFPLLSGFLLLAPLFSLGFYQLLRVMDAGGRPRALDLLRGFGRAGTAAWALGFLMVFCFFIWITDALLIYALYFGVGGGPDSLAGLLDPARADRTATFLLFAGLTGFLLALGLFTVTVISLPLIFDRQVRLASAVVRSARLVFTWPLLMLGWGLLVAVLLFLTLFLLPPLFLVAFPVLACANFRACRELCREDEDTA